MKQISLGDHQKAYERRGFSLSHVMPGEVFIVRLDGRAFHSYTKGLQRPFDERLIACMQDTASDILSEFQPNVVYVQSDEITCVFVSKPESEVIFGGRTQKIISTMAAFASVRFFKHAMVNLPEHKAYATPTFDARLFTVPNKTEANNNLIWRQRDAVKNAISMVAQAHFSPKQLNGVNGVQMKEMLREKGVIFDDLPKSFTHGTVITMVTELQPLDEATITKLKKKGIEPPERVIRSVKVKSHPTHNCHFV